MAYLNFSVCESERFKYSKPNIVRALLHFPARLHETWIIICLEKEMRFVCGMHTFSRWTDQYSTFNDCPAFFIIIFYIVFLCYNISMAQHTCILVRIHVHLSPFEYECPYRVQQKLLSSEFTQPSI